MNEVDLLNLAIAIKKLTRLKLALEKLSAKDLRVAREIGIAKAMAAFSRSKMYELFKMIEQENEFVTSVSPEDFLRKYEEVKKAGKFP